MKIRSQKFGAGETGQATVEAVLVTVISFLVISGLVYQLHSGFRDFADNYFGTYLVCLLETGELPAIGGGSEEGGCGRALSYELGEAGPGLAGGGGAGGGGHARDHG